MTLTAKILAYCLLMAVGITILAILYIRDWRRENRRK